MELENSEKMKNNKKSQNEQINKMIPMINNQENNLEVILMEKDKEIMNLSEKNSELNNNLESIKNELKNKNMEISGLKSDIISFNNEKKLFEEETQKYQDEISQLNNSLKEKDKIIEESNSNHELENKKYMNLFEEQKNENNNMIENCLKLQNELNELNSKLLKKDRDIINLENIISKNREKDNQIFILKKDLIEKDKLIKDFQNKLIIANNDLQVSKNFNEERMKQLYEKSKNTNDSNIISFFVNKIQNLILFVDSYNNFESSKKIINENIVEIKEDFILYDLLEQNISILKNKIVNKYNSFLKNNNQDNNKYQKEKYKNEELMKTLKQIKINFNQKEEILNQKINQIQKVLESKDEEINILNNKIIEVTKNSTNSSFENKFNKFYSNIVSKLNTNYLKDIKLDNNNSDKNNEAKINNLRLIIDFLVEKMNNLNNFVKEYELYKSKVKDIINKKLSKSNEQNDEINGLKNNIKELNELLNQSNTYLNKSRNENGMLKKRILNLEKYINMISKNNLTGNEGSNYLLTYNNNNNRNNFLLED